MNNKTALSIKFDSDNIKNLVQHRITDGSGSVQKFKNAGSKDISARLAFQRKQKAYAITFPKTLKPFRVNGDKKWTFSKQFFQETSEKLIIWPVLPHTRKILKGHQI